MMNHWTTSVALRLVCVSLTLSATVLLLQPPLYADITQGLVGYWAFGEGAGTTAADGSGRGNTGTLVGSPTWTTGRIGGGLQFTGTNYLTVPNALGLSGGAGLTVAMWVNVSASANRTVLSKRHSTAPYYSYSISVDTQTNNRATCNVINNSGAGSSAGSANQTFARGVWQHIACVYDGSSVRMYTNGVQSGFAGSLNGSVLSSNGPLYVPMSNSSFSGAIDEVRVYNRPLSATEITELYNYSGSSGGGSGVTFVETLVTTGLEQPTAMEFAPDGRLFVLEQHGRIRVVKAGSLLPTPFATLTVDSTTERGLLGIAFDPNFATNRYLYVYYTATTPSPHNRISRLRASSTNPDRSDGTQTILFELDPLGNSPAHNGGALHFGRDGKLYVAVGENSQATQAQELGSFLGKILRLNPDGTIPLDNPTNFAGVIGSPSGNKRAIWAIGFRNPFTFAIDSSSGVLYANDVGSTDGDPGRSWEEINRIVAGANYGWPRCEGNLVRGTTTLCTNSYPAFSNPAYAYWQGENRGGGSNAAIAGGVFNRGSAFPPEYAGAYFFSDYVDNFIDVWMPTGEVRNVIEPTAAPGPVDLDIGPEGSLYYLAYAWSTMGSVYRIDPVSGGNGQPAAVVSATPTAGPPALSVFFDASSSSDPNNDSLTFEWNFGDGTTQSGRELRQVTHIYPSVGRYVATVRVVDTGGLSDTAQVTILVGNPPTSVITSPANGTLYSAGQTVSYSGSASDPEDGTLPATAYSWTIVFHHDNHSHPFLGPIAGTRSGSFTIPTVGETAPNVWYRIHLTVTDSAGLDHASSVDILPRRSTLTLASSLNGLTLMVDGGSYTTPASFQSVVGLTRTLSAPPTQTLGGINYTFVSWSDGGAATHQISTPSTNTTYTATYLPQGLVGRWTFDEGAGTTVFDSSGYGHTGTVVNGASWTTGRFGRALQFNGINYVTVPNASVLSGGARLTVSVWVNTSALASRTVLSKRHSTAPYYSYTIRVDTQNYNRASCTVMNSSGAGASAGGATNSFARGTWQHLTCVYDGTSVRMYTNGVQNGYTGSLTGNVHSSSGTLQVPTSSGGLSGSIDDVRIFNRALSATEVMNLYRGM